MGSTVPACPDRPEAGSGPRGLEPAAAGKGFRAAPLRPIARTRTSSPMRRCSHRTPGPTGGTPLDVRHTPPPTMRSGAAARPDWCHLRRSGTDCHWVCVGLAPCPSLDRSRSGRGVVINAGDAIPAPWMSAPVVTIDEAVLQAARRRWWASCTRRGPTASRSSSSWRSTRPGSASPPRSPTSRGRSTPTSSRGSTGSTSSCGPTPTTPATGRLIWWWGRKAAPSRCRPTRPTARPT